MKKLILATLFLNFGLQASTDRIHKIKWNDLEVVWLEDNRYPTYDVTFYFADGSLSDGKDRAVTSTMLSLIDSGTRRFDQGAIADNLEFYGASYGGSVIHEYSTYSVSGLVKDIVPTMKKVCHLFSDATFPKKEVNKYIKRSSAAIKNLVNDHGALVSRAFRELSLKGTPVAYPSLGKLKDLKKVHQRELISKLEYFNTKVKKRIYISGPKSVLNIKRVINEECGWKGQGRFVRSISYKKKKAQKKPKVYLITVPKANQAQVMLGRFLNYDELSDSELTSFSGSYLGGGFTSKLVEELRVKRGLTYSASAYAGNQKFYGRSLISTFTKVKTIKELLEVTRDVLNSTAKGEIKERDYKRSKGSLAGRSPFRFETSSAYLGQLMTLDHLGQSYSKLYDFPAKIRSISKVQLAKRVGEIFNWDNSTIVIVGPKSIAKELKSFGEFKMIPYKKFL